MKISSLLHLQLSALVVTLFSTKTTTTTHAQLATCGNGKLDAGEVCDGNDMFIESSNTCVKFGYKDGTLACNSDCTPDVSGCNPGICGDRFIATAANEQCDLGNLDGLTCSFFSGFNAGNLACGSDCKSFDLSDCNMCGNNEVEGSEVCDGTDLNGKDCASFGFLSGKLMCTSDCKAYDVDTGCSMDATTTPTVAPAPPPAPTDPPTGIDLEISICFSPRSTAQVLGKGITQMQDLMPNDHVYTGNGVYEPVYTFGHQQTSAPSEYLRFYTTKTNTISSSQQPPPPIEISASHLIYLADQREPVRADRVKIGHVLLQQSLDRTTAEPVTVTKIDTIVRKGAYQPLTPSGNIVVNGIQASSYVSIANDAPSIVDLATSAISEQAIFHKWLSPYRMVCMGLSKQLCENDYNDEGIVYWLQFGQQLAKFGEQQCWFLQMIGLVVVVGILNVFMVVETVFGARLGLIAIVAMGAAMCAARGGRRNNAEIVKTKEL